jgi:hypothetical protein
MRAVIFSFFLVSPAWGETPISGGDFESLVQGKTLTFSVGDAPYGVEYYAPNRRVIWSFTDGDCVNGEWFEQQTQSGPNIYFVYENSSEQQCCQVLDIEGKIRADFMNTPGTTILYEAVEAEPLVCGGLGV